MTSTTVTQKETIISNHEARKQQVDQHRRSGIYQDPTNLSHQFNRRKYRRMQHHSYQDAMRSGVSHIQYIQAKSPNVQKLQIRRVPTYDEGLQDRS